MRKKTAPISDDFSILGKDALLWVLSNKRQLSFPLPSAHHHLNLNNNHSSRMWDWTNHNHDHNHKTVLDKAKERPQPWIEGSPWHSDYNYKQRWEKKRRDYAGLPLTPAPKVGVKDYDFFSYFFNCREGFFLFFFFMTAKISLRTILFITIYSLSTPNLSYFILKFQMYPNSLFIPLKRKIIKPINR